jgi:hypothetical protein
MMHLTATSAPTASGRTSVPPVMMDRHRCKNLPENDAAKHFPIRPESIFRSRMANCLEMRCGDFHYSVIGRHASDSLAFGYVVSGSLNDEAPASKSEVADPGARAQGGDE